jgi:diguanylate cyclase (GGDEF)-like protein
MRRLFQIWNDISLEFLARGKISAEDEADFLARHDDEIARLLPLLGPIFGLTVVLFGVWDLLIDPARAGLTFAIRLALAGAGAVAYFPNRLQWNLTLRCGFIYLMHAGAVIACEFLLKDGFAYGLTGIAVCTFAVSIATMRIRDFLAILFLPSALFVALSAASMHGFELFNSLLLYALSIGMACLVMLTIRGFRARAFLLEKNLLQISRHDGMTGAYNRTFITELAQREFSLSKRYNRPLAIAMIDIDHFKAVNDNFGHDVGDLAIKALVKTCQDGLRTIDHFGRIGGEEFVCLLPETNDLDAMRCAERLRESIEALRLDTPGGSLQFTVSIGVALLTPRHADWDALLKDADVALYCAKRDGRNRVVFAATCKP